MIIQTIPHCDFIGNPVVKVKNQHSLYWSDLVELLSVHQITSNKKNVALFSCAEFDFGKSQSVQRVSDNIIYYHALILDFDHCPNTPRYRYHLNKWTHIGYTSHSHCLLDHNFRAVVDVSRPFTAAEFTKIRPVVECQIFPETEVSRKPKILDPTCLHNNHWYYLPSAPSSTHAEVWNATGRNLDIDGLLHQADEFESQEAEEYAAQFEHLKNNDFDDDPDQDRQRVLSYFHKNQPFVGYEPTWAQVCATMKSLDFTLKDFQTVTAIIMNQKTAADARKKWAAAKPIRNPQMGFITNVAMGRHSNLNQT